MTNPQQAPQRRSSAPALVLVVGAAVAVLAVLAAVLVVFLGRDGADGVKARFEAPYVGTWKGVVAQKRPVQARYVVTVVIEPDSAKGRITYENEPTASVKWSCSGTLTWEKKSKDRDYKTVVREEITEQHDSQCDPASWDVLFPKADGTGMFITTYLTKDAADADKDYNAIGTLFKQ